MSTYVNNLIRKMRERLTEARENLKKDDPRVKKPLENHEFGEFKMEHAGQGQISEYLGCSRQQYGFFETGTRDVVPDAMQLAKLCELYDCDMGYLFGEYNPRHRRAAGVDTATGLSIEAVEELCNPHHKATKLFISDLLLSDQLVSLVSEYAACKEIARQSKAFKRVSKHQELQSAYGTYRLYPSNASRMQFVYKMCDALEIPTDHICDDTEHEQEENDALNIAQTKLIIGAELLAAQKAQDQEKIIDLEMKYKFYSYEYELFVEYEKAGRLGRMAALFTQFVDS